MYRHTSFMLLFAGLVGYALLIGSFSEYMQHRPVIVKLGYVPSIKLLKPLSADQRELAGASLVMKVMMYFGGVAERAASDTCINSPPDLQSMSRLLHGAVQLDPYNMDAYYFAQSILVWDARQFKVANELLDYGMKYRDWDWYLPFFAGFNSAYFMNDYVKAADYYKRAGELSGQDLFKNLAGRYMQESGRTDLAILYLAAMERNERNEAVKKNFGTRLSAFKEVRRVEMARDAYLASGGRLPVTIEKLTQSGYLSGVPADPYGGTFYLEPDGRVATTSKFVFGGKR